MISGIVLMLAALGGFGVLAVWSVSEPDDPDLLVGAVMIVVAGLLGLVGGAIVLLGGLRLYALRSYPLVLTAAILVVVIGFLACQPLALAGIWPLVVLMDSEVKSAFDAPDG
jgi:hypothetical protein